MNTVTKIISILLVSLQIIKCIIIRMYYFRTFNTTFKGKIKGVQKYLHYFYLITYIIIETKRNYEIENPTNANNRHIRIRNA